MLPSADRRMPSTRVLLFLSLVLPTLLAGCIGGPCKYKDVPGTCTIASIEDADDTSNICTLDVGDTAVVTFDYVGTAEGVTPVSGLSLKIGPGGGFDPPRAFLTDEGLTVGSSHPCVRRECTHGGCGNYYTFNNIDLEAAYDQYCDQQ